MANLKENLERVAKLEQITSEAKKEYDKVEATATVHKEQFEQKKELLAEKNIIFNTPSELNELYQSKKERLEQLLDSFESVAGVTQD